jgi:hypothetical protein
MFTCDAWSSCSRAMPGSGRVKQHWHCALTFSLNDVASIDTKSVSSFMVNYGNNSDCQINTGCNRVTLLLFHPMYLLTATIKFNEIFYTYRVRQKKGNIKLLRLSQQPFDRITWNFNCKYAYTSKMLCKKIYLISCTQNSNDQYATKYVQSCFVPLWRRVSFISCHDNDVLTSVGRRIPDTEGRRCWDSNPGPYGSACPVVWAFSH